MIKNKAPYIYLPIAFAAVLIGGIFLGKNLNPATESGKRGKFEDVLDYVYKEYVDTVSKDKLTDLALSLMLPRLDPHSSYIPASELKAVNESMHGNFEGIGVEFNIQRDTILVVTALTGGPSEKVGIKAGDRIVKINGTRVAGIGIKNNDVISKLRGTGGTKVTVSIVRAGTMKKPVDFIITRGTIPIHSIETSYMVEGDVGYVKLTRFSETSYDEFMQAASRLRMLGMHRMILDLRDNPGGLLDVCIDIADEFLPEGKMIVYTEGRHYKRENAYATAEGILESIPLVVLVDEGSASASEIIAGAIQDNDRGTVVGRRSFGKGLVQHQQMLKDSSALRLTVARYYTPTGRSIQKPYGEGGVDDYYAEVSHRYDTGELENADSIKQNKKERFTTPKGKVVYGGGGIMPDVFVPLDTMNITAYYTALFAKGVINDFALDYVDRNRSSLESRYKNNARAFAENFVVDEGIISSLVAFAAKRGVPENAAQLSRSLALIKNNLKAFIGRDVAGSEASYRTFNSADKAFIKALAEVKKQ